MSVDYDFYTGVYGGALVPREEFARAVQRAQEQLDADTRGGSARQLAQDGPHAQRVRLALCALAEECRQTQTGAAQGGIKKETVGSWSREYAAVPEGERSVRILQAERRYLADTGLLYRGRCRRV